MEIVETDQCFERLFCRVATQEKDVEIISSMLKVFSSEHLVTFAHRKKYLQLKNAKNVGERIKDVDVCENSFACNSTGPELIVNTIKYIPMQYAVGRIMSTIVTSSIADFTTIYAAPYQLWSQSQQQPLL